MCGVVGVRDYRSGKAVERSVVEAMTRCLSHRGPDDWGCFVDGERGVALGHQRLSVLDLSERGRQPMARVGVKVSYNGEIYNFREMREELVAKGRTFGTDTDTEVLLASYEEWGMGMLRRFHGMFAFVLWDEARGEMVLCRDRVGVKPLYYYAKDGLLLAASELKALHRHPEFEKRINLKALSLFLQLGYIPAPLTIFEDTHKVEPGTYIVFDRAGQKRETRYWDVRDAFAQKPFAKTEEEMVEEAEEVLKRAFALRLVSDVPVGVFLSGGVDSATLAALLQAQVSQPIRTFSIGFAEKGYDEAPLAGRIAKDIGSDHRELYCTKEMASSVLPSLPEMYDEPFGDSSAIPTYLVSQLARGSVTVALSGDGGDELFGGYAKYDAIVQYMKWRGRLPNFTFEGLGFLLGILSAERAEQVYELLPASMKRYTNVKDKLYKLRNLVRERELPDVFRMAATFWTERQLQDLFAVFVPSAKEDLYGFEAMRGFDAVSAMQAADVKTYLADDVLVRVDRASMAVGLENREPFLDQEVVEYAARVPAVWKVRDGKGKYLLRRVLSKHLSPEITERPKQGFGIPIYSWIRQDFSRFLQEFLAPGELKKHGLFSEQEVARNLRRYLEGRGGNAHKLWYLLMFQMWYERWMR